MGARLHCRHVLKGGLGALTAAPAEKVLGIAAVAKDLADHVVVPAGYTATVIYATGDSIDPAIPDYHNDGSDDTFSRRAGDHHDAMHWFGLGADGVSRDPTSNDRGLLCMNHENIAGTVLYLHAAGQTNAGTGARPEVEATKEIEAHGVSVIDLGRTAGKLGLRKRSPFNRRMAGQRPRHRRGVRPRRGGLRRPSGRGRGGNRMSLLGSLRRGAIGAN